MAVPAEENPAGSSVAGCRADFRPRDGGAAAAHHLEPHSPEEADQEAAAVALFAADSLAVAAAAVVLVALAVAAVAPAAAVVAVASVASALALAVPAAALLRCI